MIPKIIVPYANITFNYKEIIILLLPLKSGYTKWDEIALNNKVKGIIVDVSSFTVDTIRCVIKINEGALEELKGEDDLIISYVPYTRGVTSECYYISGHGNLTFDEFNKHYIPLINIALANNDRFIIGDYKGCDTLAMEYLKDKTSNVTICHMKEQPRYKVSEIDLKSKDWTYVSGFTSDEARDRYMSEHSDFDIAWERDDTKPSGTKNNISRRNKM